MATPVVPARTSSPAGPPDAVLACFDAVPAMLWSLEGPQLRVAAANAGARASVDDRPDLLGAPFRDVLPDAEGVHAMLEEAFAAGEPASGEHVRRLTGEDGLPTDGVCTWSALPTFHRDGSVRGLAVAVADTTEQAHRWIAAEEAAATAEQRYREVRGSAHDAAVELRRALLPSGVPVLARLRLAVRYRVAEHPPAAGGDWFDAVPLGDGRIALFVGSVAGRGVEAAGAMGQLRAVAVEAVVAGEDPDAVLGRLDRFAAMTRATRAASVCLAVLDPASGELVVGCHAHPEPLVVAADGTTRFLAVEPAWPLGTGGPKPQLHRDTLAQGELLLLYTDGLVERPGRRLQDTTAALARVASAAVRDPAAAGSAALADATAATVLDRLAVLGSAPAGGGYRDDATLLVAHLRPPLAPLRVRLAAEPAVLAAVRQRLAAWLDEAGVPAAEAVPLLHATGEAVTNAVEHAYGPGGAARGDDAWVEVRAQLTRTSEVRIGVRDGGTWRDPVTGVTGRGRGTLLMREQVDDATVHSDAGGTTVTLTRRAERPAVVGPDVSARPATGDTDELEIDVEDGRVRIRGPVDLATVGRVRAALQATGRDGRLLVDLGGVTQLAAAGVHLLHDLAAQDPDLRIVAPPDAPAHTVLGLAGLGDRVLPDA